MKPFAFGIRKARKGNESNSLVLGMPALWVRNNSISPGSPIWMEMGENGELRIFPYSRERFEQMMMEKKRNEGKK